MDAQPTPTPKYHRFYQSVILFTVAVSVYYLYYRIAYTLNPEAMGLSILFLYAEVHGFLFLCLYFFQIWHPIKRTPPPAPSGLNVAVLITTFNEDMDLLRKTLKGALAIEYPHETYVLDDGNREECRQLVEELGCLYLRRENRDNGKAGNLNNALKHVDAEFVVVFDADHVPRPEFLDRTLGYFDDPKVAVVQTPQQFYNCDSFTFNVDRRHKTLWNDQDVFFHLVLPGRDYWDSAYFVGTNAVIRTNALEEVGGFAEETITEDLRTSLRMLNEGWRCVYHHETLALGLAPRDIQNYHRQRLRWCEGNVGDLFHEHILGSAKLTFPQKLCFFAVLFTWLLGFCKVIYFVMPSIILLTDTYPIVNFGWPFLSVYLFWLTTLIVGYKIASRGYGMLKEEEQFNMLNFFVLIKGTILGILGKGNVFKVTNKRKGAEGTLSWVWPQVILAGVSLTAGFWGSLKVLHDLSADAIATSIVSFWAIVNGLLAFSTLRRVGITKLQRDLYRVPGDLAVIIHAGDEKILAVAKDFHEEGLLLEASKTIPSEIEEVDLILELGEKNFYVDGVIRHRGSDRNIYGVEFEHLSQEQKDTLSSFMLQCAMPQFFERYSHHTSLEDWMEERHKRQMYKKRGEERRFCSYPVMLPNGDAAVTRDISPHGLSILTTHPLAITDEVITLSLVTPEGRIPVKGKVKHEFQERPDHRHHYGFELEALSLEGQHRLDALCHKET